MRLSKCALSVLATAALLSACGGGGSSYSSASTATATTYSGVFLDAPTKGLSYLASPSGLSGTTDAGGKFNFQSGDTVTFTLGVGSGPIAVGSWQPAVPSGGASALVFVQSLNNGLQVAQILQSLNHGSATAMDVSGLALAASDVTNINNFIASGGTALPLGAASDVALLASVQANAGSQPFVVAGGASVSATLSALKTTISGLPATAGIALGSVLPGQAVFHEGSVSGSGSTHADFGITYFKTDQTIANVNANAGNSIQTGATYSTANSAGNVLTISGGGITDTITVSYIDKAQGLWSDRASDASTGAGSYAFLQSTFAPSVVAGKTLTIAGSIGKCGGVPFQLTVDSLGANFQTNCQGSMPGTKGSGTIASSAIPGVLTFTDSTSGSVHYVGLVAGGTIAKGSLAVVEATASTSASNGIFGVTAQ
jgi:hypothetical protein